MSKIISARITDILFINLDRNKLKRYLLECLLSKLSLSYRRVPGVICNVADIQKNHPIADYLYVSDSRRLQGVIGCWLAHQNALTSIDKDLPGFTLVLEDDFTCKDGFFETLLNRLDDLEEQFDIAIVDPRGLGPFEKFRIENGIYRTGGLSCPHYIGSHCILIRNSSVEKIVAIKAMNCIMDYDGFLLSCGSLNTILIYTELSGTLDLGSDIARSNRFRIAMNFMRYFLYLKFKRKDDFA